MLVVGFRPPLSFYLILSLSVEHGAASETRTADVLCVLLVPGEKTNRVNMAHDIDQHGWREKSVQNFWPYPTSFFFSFFPQKLVITFSDVTPGLIWFLNFSGKSFVFLNFRVILTTNQYHNLFSVIHHSGWQEFQMFPFLLPGGLKRKSCCFFFKRVSCWLILIVRSCRCLGVQNWPGIIGMCFHFRHRGC